MQKSYEFYITPDEYDTALKNGISKQTLEERVRTLAWDKETAITKEVSKHKKIDKNIIELAEQNGICYRTLLYRITGLGLDPIIAATKPLQDRKKHAEKLKKNNRKYPIELIEKAKKNGINYDTFRRRVKSGWSLEDAATRPTMTSREIGLMTKEKRSNQLSFLFIKKGRKNG